MSGSQDTAPALTRINSSVNMACHVSDKVLLTIHCEVAMSKYWRGLLKNLKWEFDVGGWGGGAMSLQLFYRQIPWRRLPQCITPDTVSCGDVMFCETRNSDWLSRAASAPDCRISTRHCSAKLQAWSSRDLSFWPRDVAISKSATNFKLWNQKWRTIAVLKS